MWGGPQKWISEKWGGGPLCKNKVVNNININFNKVDKQREGSGKVDIFCNIRTFYDAFLAFSDRH